MSDDRIVPAYAEGSLTQSKQTSTSTGDREDNKDTPVTEERGGWDKVRTVMTVVGASLNFHTLRDRYGEVVLDPAKLKFISIIAEGNYGTVSRYEYKEDNGDTTYLAIKRLRPGDISAQNLLDFMKEVKILRQLRHSRIAAFRGTGNLPSETEGEEDDVFLAQELMEGGTLRSQLELQRHHKGPPLYKLSQGLQWLLDVALALGYLHNSEPLVIHRDLKPENIMLTKDNVAKIVDFGLHKVVDRWEREDARDEDGMYDMTGGTGAYIYMAPEAFMGQRYNHKVDVYAFAVVAWEIVHRQMLIAKVCITGSTSEVKNYAKMVATDGYRPKISNKLPQDLGTLIGDMWKKEPNERPEFVEIITRLRKILDVVKEEEEQEEERVVEIEPVVQPVNEKPDRCCCFGHFSMYFRSG